jgi:hypothetical protein
MTATFCTVCEYLILSSDAECPLCGWQTNSIPVVFGVEQVRKIISNVHHWEHENHKEHDKLHMDTFKELKSEIEAMQTSLNDACDALQDCGFDISGKSIAQSIQLLKLMNKDLAVQVVDRGESYKKLRHSRVAIEKIQPE